MKTIIELDSQDILAIIAKYYEVSADNVSMEYHMESRGYGLNEQEVSTVKVIVVK